MAGIYDRFDTVTSNNLHLMDLNVPIAKMSTTSGCSSETACWAQKRQLHFYTNVKSAFAWMLNNSLLVTLMLW